MTKKQTNNPNGRPLGKPNKRSKQIADEAEEADVSPTKLLIKILSGEKTDICKEPVTKEDWKWALSELLPYTAGKRKPVDADGKDDADPIAAFLEKISGS